MAADVVSMDSSLPLKKRDSLGRASGDLPKIGMELFLNEKQMSDIDALIAQNANIDTIVAKYSQTPESDNRCVGTIGVYVLARSVDWRCVG